MARKKYRYIVSDPCMPYTQISKCRLYSNTDISHFKDVVRITIPDDLELIRKKNCEITPDSRKLREFEYVVLVKVNGKWVQRPDLNCIKKSNRECYY